MIKAKKRFGQNFLKDARVKQQIIESMPESGCKIVEIGPGLGDLTEKLLERSSVTAVEIDTDLYHTLRVKFNKALREDRLHLINADAHELLSRGEFMHEPYDLIANLPYYVATPIILSLLRDKWCKNILVMVQFEVAKKFTAHPGEKAFSSLSVLAQTVGTSQLLFEVPPEAFEPKPKVTSAVFEIRKEKASYDEPFSRFLKVAFSAPRKKLFKSLSAHYDKNHLATLFDELKLEETVRAHQVSTEIYLQLFSALNTK